MRASRSSQRFTKEELNKNATRFEDIFSVNSSVVNMNIEERIFLESWEINRTTGKRKHIFI